MQALRVALLVLPALAIACPAEPGPPVDDTLDQRVVPPTAPAADRGVQLLLPETIIRAGADQQWCYVSDFVPSEDLLVTDAIGFQGAMGHHIAMYGSSIPRDAGEVFDCSNSESMASLLPLLIPEATGKSTARILPEGFAVRLPKDSVIVVQVHYVNASDQDIKIRDVVNMEWAEAGTDPVEASYFVFNESRLDQPPGVSTVDSVCTVDEHTQVLFLLGHMHEWGKAISLQRERAGVMEEIYAVDEWTAEYRDDAPVQNFTPEAPLVFEAGDKLHVSCSYTNDKATNLRFPQEMCVVFMTYFPARGDGFIFCDPE